MNERDVKLLAEGARYPMWRGWFSEVWRTIGFAYWRDLLWCRLDVKSDAPKGDLKDVFGKWPGDESDDEIWAMLEEMS